MGNKKTMPTPPPFVHMTIVLTTLFLVHTTKSKKQLNPLGFSLPLLVHMTKSA